MTPPWDAMDAPDNSTEISDVEGHRDTARLLPTQWGGRPPPWCGGSTQASGAAHRRLLGFILLGMAALAAMSGTVAWGAWRWRYRPQGSAGAPLHAASVLRLAETLTGSSCERCPVGVCVRCSSGACHTHGPDGRYHCKVRDCSEVPASTADGSGRTSECWVEDGQAYYSLRGDHAPCRGQPPASSRDIFERIANEVEEETLEHDPRLAAYWDISDCGPAGDDHNSAWCGGITDEPRCEGIVSVKREVCESEHARFAVLHRGSNHGGHVDINGCPFMYYAQYLCLATTTTTTSTTTITMSTTTTTTSTETTTTTTISTTSTTTSTMTTSTTTTQTTLLQEGNHVQRMERLEKQLLRDGDSGGWSDEAGFGHSCAARFQPPPAPRLATAHNGVWLPDVCFKVRGPHYVHIIGDWGGILGPHGPKAASQRPDDLFVDGVDDRPQQRVAAQMAARARLRSPDYVLNVGDSFYWGGLDVACGISAQVIASTGQLKWNFEEIYKGKGLDDKPWLGVLGNHDYGGFRFDKGWDQLIAYTWRPNGRWMMPAQYWGSKVRYPGFSVDYYFVDTNVWNALDPHADPEHNICSTMHCAKNATCGAEGPSVFDCSTWFGKLWSAQKAWLEERLARSTADWQIVVTHFPPYFGKDVWMDLARRHGIDLIITGHVHKQEVHTSGDPTNFLSPTAWIVSGGGGGITSEDVPDSEGNDDQYGFFELTLFKDVIEVQSISHGGFIRKVAFLHPRPRAELSKKSGGE